MDTTIKYIFLALVLFAGISSGKAQDTTYADTSGVVSAEAPAGQKHIWQGADCEGYDKPLTIFAGDTIIIDCDTAILINTTRYRLYERAKGTVMGLDWGIVNDLINEYEEKIRLCEASKREIIDQVKNRVDSTALAINGSTTRLETVRDDLSNTQKVLEDASKELTEAKKRIRKERILWGIGGALIGVIAGILIQ